jgi:hypothetical protein
VWNKTGETKAQWIWFLTRALKILPCRIWHEALNNVAGLEAQMMYTFISR